MDEITQRLNDARRCLLNTAPDEDDLHKWIFNVLGIYLPKYQICEGHASPYQYFHDRYFFKELKTIAWACRSGGKSFMTGLQCWLKARFMPRWEANILAGSYEQAKKSYAATLRFWNLVIDIKGEDVLAKEPLLSYTEFKNGSKYTILTASTKQARGPHQPELFLDEIDEMDANVLNDAMQQPQTMNGYPASWHLVSTLHNSSGLMSDWVDNAYIRGYKLYTWCILEVMEACNDYNCNTCYLDKWCQRRMLPVMRQAEIEQGKSKATLGYNTVEDVVNKCKNAEMPELTGAGIVLKPLDIEADLFCKRPSRSGLVYKEFDRNKHIVNDIVIDENWTKYRTFDFGFQNPWVCLYIAEDGLGRLYIYKEIYKTNVTTPMMIGELTDSKQYAYNVADPAGASDREMLLQAGIPTLAPKSPSVTGGILFVRNALADKLDGKPGLIISGNCPNTIFEFEKGYRYPDNVITDVPIKDNDHACDSLRNYLLVKKQGGIRQSKGQY